MIVWFHQEKWLNENKLFRGGWGRGRTLFFLATEEIPNMLSQQQDREKDSKISQSIEGNFTTW